jgi:transcriptional regulator with XRE-family HTH domain
VNENKAGITVRILRMAAGLTTSDLAQKSCISTSLLSLIEKGLRHPSMEVIKKISQALQIPVSSFLILLSDEDDVHTSDDTAKEIVSIVDDLTKMEAKLRQILNRNDKNIKD